ncbi:arylesterase [Pedobacter sp.]|uniref:arylesterase n=1 Tax=Pedobacter sp. TaxID=1411316 RepID=UPI003D7FD7C4
MLRVKILSSMVLCGVFFGGCGQKSNREAGDPEVNFRPTESAPVATPLPVDKENILFFGTSLTAGLGLEQNEAYPALIQKKIDSLNLPYQVVNGGLSGETSAAGKSRVDWLLKKPVKVFVLELGANDGLRGIPVAQTTTNLQAIIDKVKEKYPDAKLVLLGMQMPPNMGKSYTADFKAMFEKLAKKNDMVFVPFLLDGVGGVAQLNQSDGVHPTAEGQKIMAENVWVKLKDIL